MGHWRRTELQKDRGFLRFPDFSQPSPLCRFHITADSKPRRRRRRHAPGLLQPPHSPQPACGVPNELVSDKARLVNVVWRRRRMRPVFRPDSPQKTPPTV
ncbi:hypothetical protein PAMA_017408 [Pampus argenteus]